MNTSFCKLRRRHNFLDSLLPRQRPLLRLLYWALFPTQSLNVTGPRPSCLFSLHPFSQSSYPVPWLKIQLNADGPQPRTSVPIFLHSTASISPLECSVQFSPSVVSDSLQPHVSNRNHDFPLQTWFPCKGKKHHRSPKCSSFSFPPIRTSIHQKEQCENGTQLSSLPTCGLYYLQI